MKLLNAQDSRKAMRPSAAASTHDLLPSQADGLMLEGQHIPRRRITMASQMARSASIGPMGYSSMGGGDGGIGSSGYTNVYDPIISRDFLELPQDLNIRWAWYRHFYRHNAWVNRAIDLHCTLPISRISLKPPKGQNKTQNEFVKDFFQRMLDRIGLLTHMITATREYNLVGNFFAYAQDEEDTLDSEEDPYNNYPENDFKKIFDETTNRERETSDEERLRLKKEWYAERFGKRNPRYKGWEKLTLLPVENIRIQSFEFDPRVYYQYVPGNTGHPYINRPYTVMDTRNYLLNPLRRSIPQELFDLYEEVEQFGQPLDLPTDPYEGSAVCHVARAAADFDELGMSALDCVLLPLIHKDKLRQINTLIINRRMTPLRVISTEDTSIRDLQDLRAQIDAALHTPDFSIITNFPLQWEEIGGQDRLLEQQGMEEVTREIMIGLKVNEGVLTGDNTYGGNRISSEILNVEYLQYRETVLEWYIEEFIFKPVAYKKGFIEIDEFGNEVLLYPKVRFSRLGIRDNEQLYDQVFNLYLKGSLPLSVVLDLLDFDVDEVEEGVKDDMLTVRDAKFNDMWARVLDELAARLVDQTDLLDRLIAYLQVEQTGSPEGGEEEGGPGFGRFGSGKPDENAMEHVHAAVKKVVGETLGQKRLAEEHPQTDEGLAQVVQQRRKKNAVRFRGVGRYAPGGKGNLLPIEES